MISFDSGLNDAQGGPATALAENPLLGSWTGPFGAPPFDRIRPEHFVPAFEETMRRQKAAVEAIATAEAEPGFEATIVALERSGLGLARVAEVFFNLVGADSSEALQAIERQVAPVLARHVNEIHLDPRLFARIEALFQARERLDLSPEQRRVLERYRTVFLRAGAGLPEAAKRRLAAITERLASLGTQFSQNVLADEQAYKLVLGGEADLAGLPDFVRAAAAAAASERGLPGKHVITLLRSSIEPFLQFSTRRDLREKAFSAWIARGENGGPSDNRALIAEMLELRAERARLLGYPSFAHYRLHDTMAKTPEAALGLLDLVWGPARARVREEGLQLQALVAEEGGNFALAPWDWRHYAERLRKARYDFDEAELKPYLQLERIIEAAFHTAERLFGLRFEERRDVPTYHPDVRVWEVRRADGRPVGLFFGDYFARPSKRSGAWMGSFQEQHRLAGEVVPIVLNVMNFSKTGAGEATLLSLDDARTLFHEFGHALHGLLSDVVHPLLSGTNVARDFVEFPSQLYEHWLEQPQILERFARHYRTGAPMPAELLRKVLAARNFDQGFLTVEYTASALVDIRLHMLPSYAGLDIGAFERQSLADIGMPEAIVMRHRPTHFGHVFAGESYAAGYYSYLWSEVLDADGFGAFVEAGDPFHAETAKLLHDYVYSAGYLRDPEEAYRAFRGRLPAPEALLRKRGLVAERAA